MPGQQACENLMLRLNLSIPNGRQIAAFEIIQEACTISQSRLNSELFAPVIAELDMVSSDGLLGDQMLASVSWESMASMPCCLPSKPSAEWPYGTGRPGSERS